MIKNLTESEILVNLVEGETKTNNWVINAVDYEKIYKVIFTSAQEFLKTVQDKNQKVALKYIDLAGNMILAAVIEYHKNEENEEVGGNWSFVYTFDQADLNNAVVYTSNDSPYLQILNMVSERDFGFYFTPLFTIKIMECCLKYLIDWLDQNASTNEVVELLLEDYFKASVAVEDGIKVMSIIPDGTAKASIKDDDAVSEDVQ